VSEHDYHCPECGYRLAESATEQWKCTNCSAYVTADQLLAHIHAERAELKRQLSQVAEALGDAHVDGHGGDIASAVRELGECNTANEALADKAEQERDRCNDDGPCRHDRPTRHAWTTSCRALEKHNDRAREVAQMLIAEIGASGPESLQETARCAVEVIRKLKSELASTEGQLELRRKERDVLHHERGRLFPRFDAELGAGR
jgi:DNA-directed RNA polymerase subunit RPC12/RpoP